MEQKTNGLSSEEVIRSREKHGENTLTPPKRESILKLFLEKFDDPIIKILIVAAILSLVIAFIHSDFTETIGIIVAIFLSTVVGFWFEYDAQKKFDILNSVNDLSEVRVFRDGHVQYVPKKDIVVGDVIMLEAGEEIPADGTLIEAISLGVNESTLTGELFVEKTVDVSQFDPNATYKSNNLLRGTTAIEGSGVFVVDKIGDETEFGKVAIASTSKTIEKTPLTVQLDKLAGVISIIGSSLSFLTFFILFTKHIISNIHSFNNIQIITLTICSLAILNLLTRGIISMVNSTISLAIPKFKKIKKPSWNIIFIISGLIIIAPLTYLYIKGVDIFSLESWIGIETLSALLNYFMIAVSLIVMAVPEGLPMSVTLSLALNMRRMLKSNNLVRKMHACETMGAINVICTDKTGTLTQNVMSVTDMVIYDGVDKDIVYEGIATNSTSHLDLTKDKSRPTAIGNPTESALLIWLNELGVDYNTIRSAGDIVDQLAFSSERKCMLTLINSEVLKGKRVLYIKGAPEVVLQRSTLSQVERARYESQLSDLQNQAKRTLAFGYAIIEDGDNCEELFENTDFTFIGIAGIEDPVRVDVPNAILECVNAGITIKIVTGDTPATAIEIARRIGLWDDKVDSIEKNHITGTAFAKLSDEELLDVILDFKIISRARPADKQRLVQTLQKKGCIVAVTGDGTNDAPALNFAHVGLSMGSGTSVAKEASDITIIDDSFSSISTAVMWGRSLYRNIQRFLLFQLTINFIALGIVLLGVMLGSESPLTITQILWVNIIMDTLAAAGLASLPPMRSVMKEKPRKPSDFIISKAMLNNIIWTGAIMVALLSVLFTMLNDYYTDAVKAQTVFFTVFVMIQFWNMFNAKVFENGFTSAFSNLKENKVFIYISGLIVLGQFLIVSFGGKMFRCTPLSLNEWLVIISSTSIILVVGELIRLIKRRSLGKRQA